MYITQGINTDHIVTESCPGQSSSTYTRNFEMQPLSYPIIPLCFFVKRPCVFCG